MKASSALPPDAVSELLDRDLLSATLNINEIKRVGLRLTAVGAIRCHCG